MRPIFIIGYMATGKSTFGRALAKELGRDFIDLDFYITQRFRKSVREIFDESGEDSFRKIEKEMLHEVGEFSSAVISCGGGTPCFFDNIDYMLGHGNVVCLRADEECLLRRLTRNPHKRPLVAGKTPEEIRVIIKDGLAARNPFYSRANIIFQGDSLEDRREIDHSVAAFLALHPADTL